MKKTVERNPLFHTIAFTPEERRKIDAASKISGWASGKSALFARQILLTTVQAILHRETPGERLRRRLAAINRTAA
jgi:hypothetical protein